jgi:hypothetical protein
LLLQAAGKATAARAQPPRHDAKMTLTKDGFNDRFYVSFLPLGSVSFRPIPDTSLTLCYDPSGRDLLEGQLRGDTR